jgi:hypothetical protein
MAVSAAVGEPAVMVGATRVVPAVAVAVGMGDTTSVGEAVSGGSVAGSGVDDGDGDGTGTIVGRTVVGGDAGVAMGATVGDTIAGDATGVAVGSTVAETIAGDGSGVAEGNTSGDTVAGIEGVGAMGETVGDGSGGSVGAATGAGSVARPAGAAGIGGVETATFGAGRIPPKRTTRMITPVRNASAARINCTLGRRGGSGSICYLSSTIGRGLYRASRTDVNTLRRTHRAALFAEHERSAPSNAIVVVAVANAQQHPVSLDLHLWVGNPWLRATERSVVPDHRLSADQTDRCWIAAAPQCQVIDQARQQIVGQHRLFDNRRWRWLQCRTGQHQRGNVRWRRNRRGCNGRLWRDRRRLW